MSSSIATWMREHHLPIREIALGVHHDDRTMSVLAWKPVTGIGRVDTAGGRPGQKGRRPALVRARTVLDVTKCPFLKEQAKTERGGHGCAAGLVATGERLPRGLVKDVGVGTRGEKQSEQ